jgi:hypothetical protein
MNARSLHEIATGKPHKAHRFDRTEFNARMRAAEKHDRDGKEPGKRNGPLGHVALEVLREMMRMVCWKTGRLDPSIGTICARIGRCREAVTQAQARLKAAGFLDWVRRIEPVENPDPDGPQVKQATNAYALTLPKAAADLVRRLMRRPTEAQRDAADTRDRQARAHAAATEYEQAADVAVAMADPTTPIGRACLALGLAVDQSTASPPGGQNPALQG